MEEEILELFELHYSDLLLLSSDQEPKSSEEHQRLDFISKTIMQNLGPKGPGLLSVIGVPNAPHLRETLLPLARKLALLNNDDRKRVLKEHNLGSDVPLKNLDRIVSSFAMQMKYNQGFDIVAKVNEEDVEVDFADFKNLGFAFQELGSCMMELGILLARVCDKMIGGSELEQSLLQCGTAKSRLIHYHSVADNVVIKEKARGKRFQARNQREGAKILDDSEMDLWQQWHYDYGIFTILTSPMFMLSHGGDEWECESLSGHTHLQVFHPEMNRVVMVKVSEGSCIVQVGESADILSKGRLNATLHCVCRPAKMDNLSRETFVVFLQPAWTKTFSLSDYPIERSSSGNQDVDKKSDGLANKISEIVPSLSSRLRDGMTFADFSRETTKQYYGGGGLQSNR